MKLIKVGDVSPITVMPEDTLVILYSQGDNPPVEVCRKTFEETTVVDHVEIFGEIDERGIKTPKSCTVSKK